MSILVVDDSLSSRIALESILRSIGRPDVVLADSAEEALRILHASAPEAGTPSVDLILMDLIMPGMDGIEAVRNIKADPRLSGIPIVMVSVSEEEEQIERAFEASAIDFIEKPVKRLELRARVRSILRLKEEHDRRVLRERELERTVAELKQAMAQIKTLSGLLPICMNCRKVRDDHGYWTQVELYIQEHSEAEFSHGICPDCVRKLYPDVADIILEDDDGTN